MPAPCPSCGRARPDSCRPECPELRWPDGRLRGTLLEPLPNPPFNPDKVIPIRYWSPLGEELVAIFGAAADPAGR